jgi:hypothetical protein
MLSNEFLTLLQLGLVMGLFFFVFIGPAHFVLQLVAHWILVWLWRPAATRAR